MMKKIIYMFLILLLGNCQGQDKENAKIKITEKETSSYQINGIENGFNNFNVKYYFDIENKIPYKIYYLKNYGQYTIYYIPKVNVKKYYQNFEKETGIKPQYDELNSSYFYSISQQQKINTILKEKIKKPTDFTSFGKFIAKKYLTVENGSDYIINFPYTFNLYTNKDNLWKLKKTIQVKNYDEDVKYSNINYLTNEVTNQKDDVQNNNWNGKYYFELYNGDHKKNSFDINIKDLNNISLDYISDGNASEQYKNLTGKLINSNKIEIVFNPKYENMGVIYIENKNGDFFISGKVIYFINLSSDTFPIEKK
ncbi:hypothetical protein GCM10023210_03350 [Chryseobacterium ginsengisoli]|uniref:Lipoprotein n=2 Tax=Chryseobacterium ginsengisoli TaxID=363853 RepID=A0ABP9LRI3_9FLAO